MCLKALSTSVKADIGFLRGCYRSSRKSRSGQSVTMSDARACLMFSIAVAKSGNERAAQGRGG